MRALIAIAGVLSACGGEDGPCAELGGTYEVVLDPTESCGARDTFLRMTEPGGGPYDGDQCSGTRTRSTDGCVYEYDVTCDAFDPGGMLVGSVRVVGFSRSSTSGDRLDGTESICASDADGLICCGNFDVTWTRL